MKRDELRNIIFSVQDLTTEPVDVPEWGVTVFVRGLTAAERDDFEDQCSKLNGRNVEFNRRNIRARLCVLCACDESGTRLFEDHEATQLGTKSAAALDRVFAVASRVNGLSGDDVEELAKN